MMASLVQGNRGGKVLVVNEYRYHHHSTRRLVMHWRCWRKTCRATLQTNIFDKEERNPRIRVIRGGDNHWHPDETEQINNNQGLSAQVCRFHQSAVTRLPAYDADFNAAKERLNTLKEEPDNMVKLKIYALFKQATMGQCNAPKPGAFDFVGKAKWEAWNSLGAMSQDDAQKEYIGLINGLAGEEAPASSEPAAPEDRFWGMKVTKTNNVFRIQLNRPDKKNALTWQMYTDIATALREAAQDKDVSVAVLTGTGDYYCSGNDLSNFTNVKPEEIPQMALNGRDVLLNFVSAFIDFPKPLISLINGPAVGVSVTTLALFDAVYCTDRATFHTPFSQLGQSPEGCSSYLFPKMMGNAKAGELLFFNKKITAQEACERNLVTRIFPEDVFQKETEALVAYYGSLPPQSLQYSKTLNRDAERELLHKVNKAECELLVERWQSKECINAIMSFFSKKKS